MSLARVGLLPGVNAARAHSTQTHRHPLVVTSRVCPLAPLRAFCSAASMLVAPVLGASLVVSLVCLLEPSLPSSVRRSSVRLLLSSQLTYRHLRHGLYSRSEVLTPPHWSKCLCPRRGGAAVSILGRVTSSPYRWQLCWSGLGIPHFFLHLASARRLRLACPTAVRCLALRRFLGRDPAILAATPAAFINELTAREPADHDAMAAAVMSQHVIQAQVRHSSARACTKAMHVAHPRSTRAVAKPHSASVMLICSPLSCLTCPS